MHAAVVKFNTLANSVWPAAQDHDLFIASGFGFALVFVSGIHVGRVSRKFSSAGVHPFVNRANIQGVPLSTYVMLRCFEQLGQAAI